MTVAQIMALWAVDQEFTRAANGEKPAPSEQGTAMDAVMMSRMRLAGG